MVREVCLNVAIIEPPSCLDGDQRRFIDDNSGGAISDGIKASRWISGFVLAFLACGCRGLVSVS